MPWKPCPCRATGQLCDRCLADTVTAVATHCRAQTMVDYIARTRPHLIRVPRFADLPWPPDYDFERLVRRWMREVDDERALAVLVPRFIADAHEAWERSPNINAVREGRLNVRAWRRSVAREEEVARRQR